MPFLTRGQRRLLQYATHNGKTKGLKKRRVEDLAPVLQSRKRDKQRRYEDNTEEDSSNKAVDSMPLSSDVLEFLQAHCPKAPRKLRRNQLRFVSDLGNVSEPGGEKEQLGTFAVKRIEISEKVNAFAAVGLAALQRSALWQDIKFNGAFLLVFVEDDNEAQALASHMKKRYKLTHTLVLDGSRFPTFPAIAEDPDNTRTLADRTALVITSLQAFLAVDVRSAIWKFIGAYVIMPKFSSGVTAAEKVMNEETRKEFYEKLSRQRWRCLGHVTLAGVIAPSQKALFAPTADALTTFGRVAEKEKDDNSKKKGSGNKSGVSGGSVNTDTIDESTETSVPSFAAASEIRRPVTAHYAVVEGTRRFQTLYALLMGLRCGQGLVVHFATKESCQFMHNILYALGELPESLLLLTDYEGPSTHAPVKESEDRAKLCAQFDEVVFGAAKQEDKLSRPQKNDRVVLLSAFGLVPQRGTIFIQYDIMVDIVNFTQFVSDILTPAAYHDFVLDPVIRRPSRSRSRSRTPQPPHSSSSLQVREKEASDRVFSGEVAPKAMYQYVLVFLRKNELKAALVYLNRSAKRLNIVFDQLPHLPSATCYFLSVQKMRSLNKKQFSVQNAAYAAYRATMLLYSSIGPSDVYNEQCVDLARVGEEFGYAEPPIVDLRTRDTPFRLKEDIFRAARDRAVFERRKMRAFANEHIVGEGPQEHIVDINEEEEEL